MSQREAFEELTCGDYTVRTIGLADQVSFHIIKNGKRIGIVGITRQGTRRVDALEQIFDLVLFALMDDYAANIFAKREQALNNKARVTRNTIKGKQ